MDLVVERWQQGIGYVPQVIQVLDDSLSANIAFGVPPADVDPVRLWEVIRQAQLEEVVDALPEGLATTLGENGVRLSGGERQRVGIARALYTGPTTLIMDEATSALDAATEEQITSSLMRLRGSLRIIVIAHRLSTVRWCDRVAVLDKGRLTGLGRFDDEAESNPTLRELLRLGALDRER
jgi:ABC-type multidrug transport system fused ATPase/permease subunit